MDNALLAGRFMPLRRLGQGGMAEVFLARDTLLNEETALKIIHPHLARDRGLMQRFRTELGVSRAVRHPGIIEVKELFEGEDGRFFISMEYLPGGDLKRRISAEGALPAKEVERIAIECLEALVAAHSKGIVHRDLKPQNILFDAAGRARIADFGIARLAAGAFVPDSSLAIGTPDYCPPEIMRGESSDGRSDIYSLGATLFEAATGRLPFLANSPFRSMKLRATQEAPRASSIRPGLPARLDDAIARALERESGKRFQTARAFLEELRGSDAPQAAVPEGTREEGSPCRCPDCGASVPRSLSWCFACGRPLTKLRPAENGDAYKVVVTGPGKPGDKVDAEHREVCLRLAAGAEVDSRRLVKRIPRLPFVLAKDLARSSAEELVEALSRSGIQARSLGRASSPEDKGLVRSASFRRIAAITPRIWLIMLAFSSGMFNNIFRLFKYPPLAGALFAALIAIPPLILALSGRVPFAKLKRRAGAAIDPPLRDAARALSRPELRQLAQSIAEKRDALEDGLGAYRGAEESDRRELVAGIDGATAEAAAALVRAQELASAIDEEPGAPRERELERELDEVKGRILGYAAAFDSLSIRLSGLSLAEGRKALSELEEGLRSQADLGSGVRETREATE
jgi:hypothetical protein